MEIAVAGIKKIERRRQGLFPGINDLSFAAIAAPYHLGIVDLIVLDDGQLVTLDTFAVQLGGNVRLELITRLGSMRLAKSGQQSEE